VTVPGGLVREHLPPEEGNLQRLKVARCDRDVAGPWSLTHGELWLPFVLERRPKTTGNGKDGSGARRHYSG